MDVKVPQEILEDFRNFLYVVWTEALGLPEPAPIQYDIAYALQNLYNASSDGITRRQIQALRGAGKTYILCAFVVWLLLRDPNCKILYITANTDKAKESVRLMRQIIGMLEFCKHLIPVANSRDGADRFDVGVCKPAKDASVTAAGVTSAITGWHPDHIISDDIEISNNSRTYLMREKLLAVLAEYESMVQPKGSITILGTPHSLQSIYLTCQEHYHLRKWPAEYPNPQDADACALVAETILDAVRDDPNLIGMPTYPERFGIEALNEKKATVGPYHYALQMLLRTDAVMSEKHPLKLDNLILYDCDSQRGPVTIIWGQQDPAVDVPVRGLGQDKLHYPVHVSEEFAPYEKVIMSIDPSGGKDAVGWVIVAQLQGTLFVLDAGAYAGGHSEPTLRRLAGKLVEYGCRHVIIESNFGSGLYEKAFAPIARSIAGSVKIEGRRVTGNKEQRICDVLEPVTCTHRLVFDRKVAKCAPMMEQYVGITRDRGCLKSDDVIDALALAVEEFSSVIEFDPAKLEHKRLKEELLKEVKEISKDWTKNPDALLARSKSQSRKQDARRLTRDRTFRSFGRKRR